MPYQHAQNCNLFGNRRRLALAAAVAAVVMFPFANPAMSDDQGHGNGEARADRGLRLIDLAPIPPTAANTTAKAMYVFDISYVDQSTDTYYLADRSNAAVDVVDAKTGKFVKQLQATPAFAGFTGNNNTSGPDGVVAAYPWLFVTDAPSRVVTIDLKTGKTVSDVSTGGAPGLRADELAYDPQDGLILAINNADTPPFGTLIKVDKATGKLTVGKRVTFDAAHGVDAQNGAEQPAWDPNARRFYLSIPQVGPTVSNGGVIRINPTSATVEKVFPVSFCGPAGLALGPASHGGQDALVGCNAVFDTSGNVWDPAGTVPADPRDVVINLTTGKVDAEVFGAGAGDEVWFNAGDNNYYGTGSGSPLRPLPSATASGSTPLAVIDARDEKLASFASTFNVAAVKGTGAHPGSTSHSVAADADNNRVFVAIGANNVLLSPDGKHDCLTGCIAVFAHSDEDVTQ